MIVSLLVSAAAATPTLRPVARTMQYFQTTPPAAAANWVGSALLARLAFLIVYRFRPSVRVQRRRLLLGSVCAVVLFEAIKSGFFWYLRRLTAYPAVYGPLVGVVVLMLWIYLVALVLLTGAEAMATGW